MISVSLKQRFINRSAITLIALMSLSAIVVYVNFTKQVTQDAQEKLKLHIYNILSVAELYKESISLPTLLYHPDFNTADSGLWAEVLDVDSNAVWQSLSLDQSILNVELPINAGEWQAGQVESEDNKYLTVSYKVDWKDNGKEHVFYLVIGELKNKNTTELRRLTFWLVIGFGGITTLLLIGQYLVLIQAFQPINQIAKEINELEDGQRDQLTEHYPVELKGVERNLNALIAKERKQRERYRESMANLAHSLKTPMTIISNEIQGYPENKTLNTAISNVNGSIEYQLRRAVISGHTVLTSGVNVSSVVDLVVEAVATMYQRGYIQVDKEIDPSAVFYGDENDLMEVLGNLIDNAFKHARSKIMIRVLLAVRAIEILVEDDGPGLSDEDREKVFRRGERLDQRMPGQGLGLSIVYDIVASYDGTISVSGSNLGGACFTITFSNRE